MIDRRIALGLGIAATLGAAALWHGPAGTADAFAGKVERIARRTLVYYEMGPVNARLERGPLSRRLVLSGPADDFQRGELVRIMNQVPGVGDVRWTDTKPGAPMVALLAEAMLLALLGFGLGLLLAYLVELRRRTNAEWRW